MAFQTAALLLVAGPALAQDSPRRATAYLQGRVVAETDGSPLSGALIELMGPTDAVEARGLTGEDGRFVLRAPAGTYRVVVGLLGYASTTREGIELPPGGRVTLEITVPLQPIRLEGIRASTDSRCGRPRGSELVQVWGEVRKVLASVDVTERARTVRFQLAVRERDLHPEYGSVLREQVRVRSFWGAQSFRSAPADQLMTEGFIRTRADTSVYFAPDADLLLSDAFLDRYCFAVVDGDTDEIGLAFEPELRDRDRSQIEGALWLDRGGRGLRRLEYRYLDPPIPGGDAGGEVHYRRLPNGLWIVSEWAIRMPQPGIVNGQITRRLAGIHETSGEVVWVRGPGFTIRPGEAEEVPDPRGIEARRQALTPQAPGPPARDGEEVTRWVRSAYDPPREVLHLRNNTSSTFHVRNIILRDCDNVREACGAHPVDMVIPPGQSRALFEVHRRNPSAVVRFAWSYEGVSIGG